MPPKKQVVKKSNALINASYTITLAEQRLILLAISQSDESAESMKRLAVHARDYADRYRVTLNTAYKALQDSAAQLFERRFSYEQYNKRGNLEKVVSRWVQSVKYVEAEGVVMLSFSDDLLPLLCELKEKFTYYALEQVADLKSAHAIRLYELLISWRSTGETPVIEVDDLRRRLGLEPDEYPRMDNLKRRVLDYSIKQINEHTDISASYEQHKRGRRITGFHFTFEAKRADRDPDTMDWVNGKPDAVPSDKPKRRVITKSQAEAMGERGESYTELYRRLSRDYIVK